MFDNLSAAKRSAKTQLKFQSQIVYVVQNDDRTFDVIKFEEDHEPCIEQIVGNYAYDNDKKIWYENHQFDKDRLLPEDE